MRSFSANTHIAAGTQRVWSVLADVARWPEWLPTVTAVTPLDAPALSIGARFTVQQPRLRPAIWSVVELDLPHRFAWESRSPGVRTFADHVVAASSVETTIVTLGITFHGPLRLVAGLLAGRLTQEYLTSEAASLKQRVESDDAQGMV